MVEIFFKNLMGNKILSIFGSKSIKINYFFNFLRVFSAALVGIFTLPHITKYLGPESLGKVEYVNTVINYFILFSALGIPVYGIREVSKKRDNFHKLYTLVTELYVILLITTVISYLVIFGIIIHLNIFDKYSHLIVSMSAMVALSNMGAEWFFQGIENQFFITVRYVLLRIIVFILIFLLINQPSDYYTYGILLVILNFGANFINFFYLFNKIKKEKIKWSELDLEQHLRPVFMIFIATISINIYLQLDYFLIGSISGDKYVGYYTVANKLIRFVISFITIIGAVSLPRLTHFFENDVTKYNIYLKKSFDILMLTSLPCSIYFFIFSNDIILMFAGKGFESSILTMKILSPLCFIVGMAYFMGFLVLYPQNKEKIYTVATVISALFSIVMNMYSIKYFQQNGAAVIAVLSEFIAIVYMFFYIRKQNYIKKIWSRNIFKIVVINIIVFIFWGLIKSILVFDTNFLIFSSLLFFMSYAIILLISKEDNINYLVRRYCRL